MNTEQLKEKSVETLLNYQKSKFEFITTGDYVRIITNYLDATDHFIELYLFEEYGNYELVDNCQTFLEFEMVDFNPLNKEESKNDLESVLRLFDVEFDVHHEEIKVEFTNINDFPEMLDKMVQCVQRLSYFPLRYHRAHNQSV